jgi:hypothetical protein
LKDMLRCGCFNLCENTLCASKSWRTRSLSAVVANKLLVFRALLIPLLIFSFLTLCNDANAQGCVGNYSSVSCGGNQFCCFNDPNNCGAGSSACCSGGKACDASSNIPSWTCNGQYACVAMSAAPSGAAAGSYPIGLCSNTCMAVVPTPTPTPATSVNCASQAVSWTVAGNTCTATVGAVTNGQTTTATAVVSAKVSGVTNPQTPKGTQQFTCNNGVLSASGSGTCATTCASSANVGAVCATAHLRNWCDEINYSCNWSSFWGAWCEGTTTNLAGPQPAEYCDEIDYYGQIHSRKHNWGLSQGPAGCSWSESFTLIQKPNYPDTCTMSGTGIVKQVAQLFLGSRDCYYEYRTASSYPRYKPASCPSCTANLNPAVCDWES